MASVIRLIPRIERITRRKAADARQAILDLELPPAATETMLLTLDRHTVGKTADWIFHMLQPEQVLVVWDAIRALPGKERPHQVRHVFDLVLTHLQKDTGIVTLTRDELAERVGAAPGHVSRMMGTLARMGVIVRERAPVEGMRGPGVARYRINPHFAWHGNLAARKELAQQLPLPGLTVLEGGKAEASVVIETKEPRRDK